MAGTWDGFTEDDIKNLSQNADIIDNPKSTRKSLNTVKKQKNYNKPKPVINTPVNLELVPEEALLVKPLKNVHPELPEKTDNDNNKPQVELQAPSETLEEFNAKQRLLEEQNRQRKDFLAKVLSDRKKQTNEEAKRLQAIQDELHKLDILLSDDVAILRDQIEVASKEFGEAQKRFSRAEKEFLESKQNLFAKMERKELLTKHLCTIIEQNELRKAKKLSELMGKLSIDTGSTAELVINESGPIDKDTPSVLSQKETT